MYACLHADGNLALLVECARQFSPYFEEILPSTVLVDLRGLNLLFGSAAEIAAAMTNRAGFPVDLAIASKPDTAIFAARGFRGITVVPPGREQAALSSLSLNLLPGTPETAAILSAWGIRTFGDFAALPEAGVASRLGNEGVYLQKLVRGRGDRHLRPWEDRLRFEEEFELDSPVELLEPLSFLLARLLNDLCFRLTSRALSADEMILRLTLENAGPHECTLRLPVPMRDPKVFLKLLQLELNARPPVAPILKVYLELKPLKPRTEQHDLFQAVAPEPAKLEITLAKLINLLGAENVGTPEMIDTHRPDSFQMKRFIVVRGSSGSPLPPEPALALRRFRPSKIAQVRKKNDLPVHVSMLSLQCNVLSCAGPWRNSGDWWTAEPWDHEEWDVALSDGAIYRLHEDRRVSRWFVEGVYD
jgi:protein ImuB